MTNIQTQQAFRFNNGDASFYYQGSPDRKKLILGDIPDGIIASARNIPGDNLDEAVSLLAENIGQNARVNLSGHNLVFNTAREGAIVSANTIEGVEAKEGAIIQADEVFFRCVGKNVTICTDNPEKIRLLNCAIEPKIVPKAGFNNLVTKRIAQGGYIPQTPTIAHQNGFLHVGEVKNYKKLTPKEIINKAGKTEYNNAPCIRTGRIGLGASALVPKKYLSFSTACDNTTISAKAVSGVNAGKGSLIKADSVFLKSIGDNSVICTPDSSRVQILEKGKNLRIVDPWEFEYLAKTKANSLQRAKAKHETFCRLAGNSR